TRPRFEFGRFGPRVDPARGLFGGSASQRSGTPRCHIGVACTSRQAPASRRLGAAISAVVRRGRAACARRLLRCAPVVAAFPRRSAVRSRRILAYDGAFARDRAFRSRAGSILRTSVVGKTTALDLNRRRLAGVIGITRWGAGL